MSSIKQLDHAVVRRISTGHVIGNLASACKELIENSLDACSSNIEIMLKDNGLEQFQVADNGCGISESDFDLLGKQHCTSKLYDFSDLGQCLSYGFRGAALAALCSMSEASVITRSSTATVAYRLDFDGSGNIVRKAACARQPGTTVIVKAFLGSLAVRRKELERNIRKEIGKLSTLVQMYALICENTRFELTNVVNGKKKVLLATNSNKSIRANIADVFGVSQLSSLAEFVQAAPGEETLREFGVSAPAEDVRSTFRIEGFVSLPAFGRTTTDRQFFYVNKRPTDYPKMKKLIADVYRMFCKDDCPIIVLNINTLKNTVDPNVVPDKTTSFIENENLLLATVQCSLIDMFQGSSSIGSAAGVKHKPGADTDTEPTTSISGRHSVESQDTNLPLQDDLTFTQDTSATSFTSFGSVGAASSSSTESDRFLSFYSSPVGTLKNFVNPTRRNTDKAKRSGSADTVYPLPHKHGKTSSGVSFDANDPDTGLVRFFNLLPSTSSERSCRGINNDSADNHFGNQNDDLQISTAPHLSGSVVHNRDDSQSGSSVGDVALRSPSPFSRLPKYDVVNSLHGAGTGGSTELEPPQEVPNCSNEVDIEDAIGSDESVIIDERMVGTKRKCTALNFSLEKLKERLERCSVSSPEEMSSLEFYHPEISPSRNDAVELELEQHFRKDMFDDMEVIGQFNLGFIIAKFRHNLFIIDQHASDEKFNYETFLYSAAVQSQRLMYPVQLKLTPAEVSTVLDNQSVFEKNGIEIEPIQADASKLAIQLRALPVCYDVAFNVSDVEEIITSLMECPGVMHRPQKLKKIFASKACRKSVMIGTPLQKCEMKQILSHLAATKQPWNCPHGRPTMRHLLAWKQKDSS